MSKATTGPVRLLCFGDGAGKLWGAAVQVGAAAALVVSPERTPDDPSLEIIAENGGWRVGGAGVALHFSPAAAQASAAGDKLCHVEGTVTVDGSEREISCPGTVSAETEPVPGKLDSIRALTGWFGDERGVTLRALRPDDRKGHERDLVAATLFDPEQWVAVTDPRLSTTFRAGEQPARASLELWVGDGDELYPRRAAAEAAGQPVQAHGGELRVSLTPMVCHAGGLDGTGVYLIAHL